MTIDRLEFTVSRREAWGWLRLALSVLLFGEQKVQLHLRGPQTFSIDEREVGSDDDREEA